jgi:hypothetical protein
MIALRADVGAFIRTATSPSPIVGTNQIDAASERISL